MSWIEVQFLDQASQALQQCRQVLKWTYAFAYYLARNNLTEIFEDNQKDLEMAVENLSEMFEKPIDQLQTLKVDMMDKTSYCTKRRIILLNDTAENLKAGTCEQSAWSLRCCSSCLVALHWPNPSRSLLTLWTGNWDFNVPLTM
jgi:ariadne-1